MARQVELIVEDGTVVADANSFMTEDQIVAFALARGVNLPYATDADKDAVAVLGIQASDYLKIMSWKGEVVDPAQTMPFPRKNMGVTFPEDAVPASVIEAQKHLALLVHGGTTLIPTWSGSGFVVKEKIGPIEEVYSEKVGVSTNGLPILPGIEALLAPWLLGDLDGIVLVMLRSVGDRSYGDC